MLAARSGALTYESSVLGLVHSHALEEAVGNDIGLHGAGTGVPIQEALVFRYVNIPVRRYCTHSAVAVPDANK